MATKTDVLYICSLCLVLHLLHCLTPELLSWFLNHFQFMQNLLCMSLPISFYSIADDQRPCLTITSLSILEKYIYSNIVHLIVDVKLCIPLKYEFVQIFTVSDEETKVRYNLLPTVTAVTLIKHWITSNHRKPPMKKSCTGASQFWIQIDQKQALQYILK